LLFVLAVIAILLAIGIFFYFRFCIIISGNGIIIKFGLRFIFSLIFCNRMYLLANLIRIFSFYFFWLLFYCCTLYLFHFCCNSCRWTLLLGRDIFCLCRHWCFARWWSFILYSCYNGLFWNTISSATHLYYWYIVYGSSEFIKNAAFWIIIIFLVSWAVIRFSLFYLIIILIIAIFASSICVVAIEVFICATIFSLPCIDIVCWKTYILSAVLRIVVLCKNFTTLLADLTIIRSCCLRTLQNSLDIFTR
jgi:hypothetical protein